MFRSIGAVILGYLTGMILIMTLAVALMFAIEGKLPDPNAKAAPLTTIICICYVVVGFVAMIASGYVTAWVARRREMLHAGILIGLMFVLGSVYFLQRLNAAERPEPLWYLLTNLFLPLVTVPLGAHLRTLQVKARGL